MKKEVAVLQKHENKEQTSTQTKILKQISKFGKEFS